MQPVAANIYHRYRTKKMNRWLVFIVAAVAMNSAHGCEPPLGHESWREARLQQLFETCRDARGGQAQRKCEAKYFSYLADYKGKK